MKKSTTKIDQENQQQPTQPENTAPDLLSIAATQGGKDGTQDDAGSNVSIRLSSGNQSRQRSRSAVDNINPSPNSNNANAKENVGGKTVKRVKSVENAAGGGGKMKVKKPEKQVVEDPLKAMLKEFNQPRKKTYGRRGAPLLQPNTRIGTKYTIIQMFAGGGFGQVYRAVDEDRQITVAVKVEPKTHDPGRIILEQSVLSQLKGTPNAPTLVTFFKMDVKPSNFCIGFSGAQKRIVYLVDFGLSRQFRDKKGRLRKKRRVAAFRGTLKYVSVNVHAKKEQGPVDDFISLFYTGFELSEGFLPWRTQKDVLMVEQMKRNFKFEEHKK
uniref:Protein kinase domain-containing protein n=1 Tax=Panagrolaimus sp. ES5 TaxID=591445 RepID=A0AC34FBB0_9BILA